MSEISFKVGIAWRGRGREGTGRIAGSDVSVELSGPGPMGGRGIGTNPEELLVSAVSSCYTATLFGVLARRELPVDALEVKADGVVEGFPGRARFSKVSVDPRILGGDPDRRPEYEAAAVLAHERCLIGRALRDEVTYEVGDVEIARSPSPPAPVAENGRREADELEPAWRSGE